MKQVKELNRLNKNGLCSVPVAIKDKYPSMLKEWKRFENNLPTAADIEQFQGYWNVDKFGICLICGHVSGGLLAIDFDNHLNNAEDIFNEYTDIPEVHDIITRYQLPIETTQSGGYHIMLRCNPTPGNQKLAMQPSGETFETVIETRGQGGLIVCAPTKGYEIVSGDLMNIAEITESELNILFDYAKSFDKAPVQEKKEPRQHVESDGDRPGDIYNERTDITTLLKENGWTHIRGKLWRRPGKDTGVSATLGFVAPGVFYNFSGNAYPIEQNRGYNAFTLYAAYNHNNDLSEAARQIAKDYELKPKKPIKKQQPKAEPIIPTPGIEIKTVTTPETNKMEFWYVGKQESIKIDYQSFNDFLIAEGFYKYEINPEKGIPVKVNGNIIEEYSPDMLYQYVRKHIFRIADGEVYNKIRQNKSALTATDIMNEMETVGLDFVKDTKETTYIFYKNTAVKVTKDGYSFIRYNDLPGKVWKTQIIDREVTPVEDFEGCDASRLVNEFCDGKDDRALAFWGAIGYLLNRNKNHEQCPVIAWGDENMEQDESRGGTGKGLSMKMVRKLRNVVTVDGKNFDTTKDFALSRVSQDTDIILIDDVDKKYDFGKLFSLVTEGLPINKKYMNEVYVDFEDAPKWSLTHNHPLPGKGDSFDRRQFPIEVHGFLSASHTPSDTFGRAFFDWPAEEWNRFDNFMLNCAQIYLKYGLQRPRYVNKEKRDLMANTPLHFPDWADNELSANEAYNKKVLFDSYKDESRDNRMTSRKFLNCLELYADYKGWNIDKYYGAGRASVYFTEKV